MRRDSIQLAGTVLALLVLCGLVLLDLVIPPEYAILSVLFALAPLLACAVVPARGTASIAGMALAATIASGVWNDTFGTPQQAVRIIDVALVGATAVAISAVRVYREHRFAQVQEIAQVAQRAILPILPSRVGHVAIATRYQSAAREALVGGDLFDCYHSNEHVRILIGDVRGKGITGVEQAARVIRAFRQSAALRSSLTEVAQEMDAYLADFFEAEEFVTGLLVDVTDPGHLRVVNAGHPDPYLVPAQDVESVRPLGTPHGLPLGLGLGTFPDAYAEAIATWQPGDRLLMYTDGLSEARDASGEFFPLALTNVPLRSDSVEDAVAGVVTAVNRHVPRGRLDDDIAVVVIEHRAESAFRLPPTQETQEEQPDRAAPGR